MAPVTAFCCLSLAKPVEKSYLSPDLLFGQVFSAEGDARLQLGFRNRFIYLEKRQPEGLRRC